jgi:AraC-like DNA-binding protein
MHSRTLTRRLKASGCNFKALVDEGRFEIAREMLQNTSLDVSRIAASLDYADASAFTRAFRRWSGATPAVWRATSRHTIQGSHGASAARNSIKQDDMAASSMRTDHRFMTSQPATSPRPSR